jgi:PAS domain-containing protein
VNTGPARDNPQNRTVRSFPTDDTVFGDFVRAWATTPAIRDPADLQHALRVRYPAALVRAQDEFGRLGSGGTVWYVFRYGVKDIAEADVELVEESGAWAIVDNERRFVAASEAFAAIVDASVEQLAGHAVEDFTSPADPTIREDLRAMWDEFKRGGRFASTIRYNYPDGRPRELAFEIVGDVEGQGRHRLTVAVIPSERQS